MVESPQKHLRLISPCAGNADKREPFLLPLLRHIIQGFRVGLKGRGKRTALGLFQHAGNARINLAEVWIAQAVAEEEKRLIEEKSLQQRGHGRLTQEEGIEI